MRALARFATSSVLFVALCACSLPRAAMQEPAPAPQAPAAAQTPAPAVAPMTEAETVAALNLLVNDTAPGSEENDARRAELSKAFTANLVPDTLRWTVSQVLSFDPPRLRQRWQEHQQAEESAAAQYAANPPVNFTALNGARVLRRLGPAYLLRLPTGETVMLESSRRFKSGTRLRRLLAVETERPKPDRSKGDLVDELADQPRMFTEIFPREAKRREAERAPALARLRDLERQGGEMTRAITADLTRLDTLTREVNAVISPRLLPQGRRPAPASFIRKVRRVAKSYSRQQYYRYALPVTGKKHVDAVLQSHLDERKAEVQDLLRTTGVGRGRARANTDRITFTAYTGSPVLLSVRFEDLRDTGGAHPNTTYASFVFDMQRQARLTLADIFTDEPAALKILSELAARRMALVLDGMTFPEGMTPKPENFAVFVIDGADLVFTFPPYQVASYARGTQTLRVPLCHPRLLPLLSPALRAALAAQ